MHSALFATLTFAIFLARAVAADPRVVATEVLGPFSGHGAALHADNVQPHRIAYYGTDLGFTYVHQGELKILFGDSWAIESYAPIEASTGSRFDDGFGTIDLERWPDGAALSPARIPLIRLGQNFGTSEMSAMDPGHAMDLGKTPMAGFSNGADEFAIFNITKPLGCSSDAECGGTLECDIGLGYLGTRYDAEEGLTLPCVDGSPYCVADTMSNADGNAIADSGFCSDRGSTVWADSPAGRLSSVALRQRVGLRDRDNPKRYATIREWLTNRYVNMTATTVEAFDPGRTRGAHDYRPAASAGHRERIFLWGRPGFVGVGASGRSLGLYFAYVDMPLAPDFDWQVHYFAGVREGVPQFSDDESEAVPLDLDATTSGVQAVEQHDIVHQMSVEWIEPLEKWVMFYGGGISTLVSPALPDCGVLQLFTNVECKKVEIGNGAIRMRTADDPWGPWSAPQDVLVGGFPDDPGSGQYRDQGVLRHAACKAETCAPHSQTPAYHADEYGFLYSANIIVPWTHRVGDDIGIVWNASTWDPYRVVLLRTTIAPQADP